VRYRCYQPHTRFYPLSFHSKQHHIALPSSNINFSKKDDFASVGIVLEHQRTSDYLTTPHETSNNFSSSTGMNVSILSCKALHRLRLLTTPCGKRVTTPSPPLRTPREKWARSAVEKAQAFADHLASVFQPHSSLFSPTGPDSAADELLLQLLEPPISFNCLSLASRVLKFNQPFTVLTQRNPLVTISSPAKYSKNCPPPPLVLNILPLFNAVLFLTYFPAQWKVA
jgi:hypothetical protein